MLLLQKLSIVLALMQFGTAVVIPSPQTPSKLSNSNIKSPVHPIPAVRPAVNRQPTVVVRAGMGEHVSKIAHLTYKVALFSPAGRCINTMMKNCIKSIKPIWEPNPFSFPIDLRFSEDWEFVGFHGTINQFFDHDQQKITVPTETRAGMNRLGEGIYVTDSIMDARYRAESYHHDCMQKLNEEMDKSDPEQRGDESKSSSLPCDYSMCAAFVSKRHWSKVNKVLLSRSTPHVWEGGAVDILQQHLSKWQLKSPVIISHVYRRGQSMEIKFPLEHSEYLILVCGLRAEGGYSK
ncbi:hypothetical protein BKA69DRAFT_1057088 [Paraphysoderma sedebokerense]|nr:hypothetical protein BKA69DRAFT_1057088 [Paraphysoderma sedebokerense]